jgi:hypothetical protein
MIKSQWHLWPWYFYPLPLCLAVSLAAFSDRYSQWVASTDIAWLRRRTTSIAALIAVVAACLWVEVRHFRASGGTAQSITDAAEHLVEFLREHEGRYAMGDRAGATAFVTGKGFLQIEGLAADHGVIDAIERSADLRSTLETYGVDYVVETLPTPLIGDDDCLTVTAPHLPAGNPQMRGRFCDPLFRYDSPLDGVTTVIYGLRSGGT